MSNDHALGQLGPDVSVVQVQIRGKAGGLPPLAWHHAPWLGDKNAAHDHGSQVTGRLFIAESERETSFVGITHALKRRGYILVHVGKRVVNTEDGKTQYVLRYTFGTIPREEKHLRRLGEDLARELEDHGAEALWNVQAFLNPYYRDGHEVEEKRVITIDINARKPLFEMKEGKLEPVMVWGGGRDKKTGKGVGEKVQLAPKSFLDVSEDGEVAIFVEQEQGIDEVVDSQGHTLSQVLRDEDVRRAEIYDV